MESKQASMGIEVITMGAGPQRGGSSIGGGVTPSAIPCGFPACEHDRVTDSGMCQVHRRVVISSTGSWLEAS